MQRRWFARHLNFAVIRVCSLSWLHVVITMSSCLGLTQNPLRENVKLILLSVLTMQIAMVFGTKEREIFKLIAASLAEWLDMMHVQVSLIGASFIVFCIGTTRLMLLHYLANNFLGKFYATNFLH